MKCLNCGKETILYKKFSLPVTSDELVVVSKYKCDICHIKETFYDKEVIEPSNHDLTLKEELDKWMAKD